MEEILDPQWTEKLERGRIIDPLHFDTVRNRILTDLLYGIQSIAITHRLRYISFSLWCLNNLEDPASPEIVPYEKLFLMANIAHDHKGPKDRGENGLSGSNNIPWNRNELLDSTKSLFSISDESFRMQSRSDKVSAFSTYYRGVMERLLLIQNLEPTPLGKSIAKEFEKNTDVEFKELQEAVSKKEASSDLISKLTSACCCLLDGHEEELLRRSFFALFPSVRNYSQLSWIKPKDTRDFQLSQKSQENVLDILDLEDAIDFERYLKRYFKGDYGLKMRKSLLMFLWITDQKGDYSKSLSDVEGLKDIRELWRLQQYYDYFNFSCEALLSSILSKLENKSKPINPSKLLVEITSNEVYTQTLENLLNGINIRQTDKDQNAKEAFYQYVYYEVPIGSESSVDLKTTPEKFNGNWNEYLEDLADLIDPNSFDVTAPLSEWGLKQLIEKEINQPSDDIDKTCSRIFAYVTALFGLLKLRYDNKFSANDYRVYWDWVSTIEQKYSGPNSLVNSLDSNQDLQSFIQNIAWTWAIKQHIKTVYERTDRSRMPRLFGTDIKGRMYHVKSQEPGLSELKFERLIDVLIELGLVKKPNNGSLTISNKGQEWLEKFLEVRR